MRIKTLLPSALFAKEGEAFASVVLPHTWNALDSQDGGADYWRGIGTYKMDLPNPTEGKKQYVEIQGANHVATVYCNGRELGTHKGGFSTFRYDLTPAMKKEGNVLTVIVTNAVSNIYPQNADFTFYGGLYRDVNFIEVNDAHFDLLLDGTEAVFVTPHNVGKTRVDLFPVNADGCEQKVTLKDAEGNVVGDATTAAADHAHVLIDVKANEVKLCGVAEHDYSYDLPEGNEGANWFDDPELVELKKAFKYPKGYFSIKDKMGDLLANPEAAALMGKMMAAAAGSGGAGGAMMSSMGEMSEEMMGFMRMMRLSDALKMAGDAVPLKMKLQINQALNQIKK